MKVSNPKRPLNPAVEKTVFENFCDKIVPYVIIITVIILLIMGLIMMVRYGANITGTEANIWYNQFGGI